MKLLTLPCGWARPQFSLGQLPLALLVVSSLSLMATSPAKAQLRLGNPMSCGQVRMHGGMGSVGFNGQVMNICIPTSTIGRSFRQTSNRGADLTIQPTNCGTGAATGVVPISLPNGNGLFAEGGLMLDEMFPMNRRGGSCPPMSVIMQLAGECQRGDSDSCGGLNRIRRSGCAI